MADGALALRRAGLYSLYVLLLLLIAYLLNQLDRYTLAIVSTPIAQELHYGDEVCMPNTSYTPAQRSGVDCKNATQPESCSTIVNSNGSDVCKWDYNGQGLAYQILAGPVFIFIYTFMGIFLGMAADAYNRKVLLAVCLIFWSVMTLLTGFVREYWQLVLLRFGLGFGEAGCTPFAASMIADLFTQELRASAMGVYNWGIYTGYSMSYALGNFISQSLGWRYVFIISGAPGIAIGILIFLTVKEPKRQSEPGIEHNVNDGEETRCQKVLRTLKPFTRPSLIVLILAGSIRNAGGYVWAYNTQPYFESVGQTPEQIGTFMSWIPLVAGSIGVVLGGFISDKFVKKRGPYGRVIVLVISQMLAAPFCAGALFLPMPWAYISLIPANIIGEMWVGVTLTLVIELVPMNIRTSAVAVYMFIITNIGGNIPLLVPILKSQFLKGGYGDTESLRNSLYVLYPGLYVLGSLFYLLSMVVMKRDIQRAQGDSYVPLDTDPRIEANEVIFDDADDISHDSGRARPM
ncbi:MFS-type efflux pump MSMEG_3705-like [Tubulanus polymorphus]|uniref:MFS-type efflux pump MSMEG_3705-like n=1 Tax=Tubulanus polymorphus TaxID=672921 RepID=UPI003DA4ACD4